MDKRFDFIIKGALSDEVNTISNSEDIFCRIDSEIKEHGDKKLKNYYKNLPAIFKYKKYISIAACLLVVCMTLTFASSTQVRAFASQAISSIKTIFTLERDGDKFQIVEKPVNEAKFINSMGSTTTKSDEELSKILGFNVTFPKIFGNFELRDKSLGVVLKNPLDMEASSKLQNLMINAAEDDDALLQLKPYDAVRFVSGKYVSPGRLTVFITTDQSWSLAELENQTKEYEKVQGFDKKEVKVGDLNGLWLKSPSPDYPLKTENGIGKSDMSVKPEIKENYSLFWEKSGTLYTLSTTHDFKLTLKESLKIAEEFMKSN